MVYGTPSCKTQFDRRHKMDSDMDYCLKQAVDHVNSYNKTLSLTLTHANVSWAFLGWVSDIGKGFGLNLGGEDLSDILISDFKPTVVIK